MDELFSNNFIPEMTKCDCTLIPRTKKPKPVIDQKTVLLHKSLDPKILVGTCNRCEKVHTKRLS